MKKTQLMALQLAMAADLLNKIPQTDCYEKNNFKSTFKNSRLDKIKNKKKRTK